MKRSACHPRQSRISGLQCPSSILLLAILLLAGFLRFYHLDAQSLWNDEGNSARIAERTPDLILEGAAGDIHPPGYYLLLHGWRALVGQSEFALRSLSVVAGLALVLFTYLLGRHLFGDATGLMAAFLGALSPFAVYYSQEARMYALLAAFSAASTFFTIRTLRPAPCDLQSALRTPHFIAYILTSGAGLYTQYAFPFVLLVHNVIFALWWVAEGRRSAHPWRRIALWGGAQVSVTILYLPWLPTALSSITGWSSAGRAYELGPAVLDVFHVLSVGTTLRVEEATASLLVTGLLLLAGLWPGLAISNHAAKSAPRDSRQAGSASWLSVACVVTYLMLPIALIFAFDLYKPSWLKFLVVVLPAFNILTAHGIQNLTALPACISRITHHAPHITRHASRMTYHALHTAPQLLLLAIVVVVSIPSLHNLYFDPAYARDDYRGLAAAIAASARPGDGIILNAPNQWEVFTYYYPDQDVYPAPYRPDPASVEPFLSPLVQRYQRLFVLYWGDAESDPHRRIETWLATHAYKAADRWYGRVRLATYGLAPLPESPTAALDARFGPAIHLRGYALEGDAFTSGSVLPLTLFWETSAAIPERYKVTVQLLDRAGQLVAQHDTEPGDGLMPTTAWEPGQDVADRYGVPLPADLPPGDYTLIAGLYHIATAERLPVFVDGEPSGDHLALCTVAVTGTPTH